MAFQTGSQIRPELSAVDYTPFAQASMQASQMAAQGIGAMTQGAVKGFEAYVQQVKENKQLEADVKASEKFGKSLLPLIKKVSPEMEDKVAGILSELADPNSSLREKAAIAKTISSSVGQMLTLSKFAQDTTEAEQARRFRDLQMSVETERLAQLKQAAADAAAKRGDIAAATFAYSQVPTTVSKKETEQQLQYVAPQANLSEFLYKGNAPAPMSKDLVSASVAPASASATPEMLAKHQQLIDELRSVEMVFDFPNLDRGAYGKQLQDRKKQIVSNLDYLSQASRDMAAKSSVTRPDQPEFKPAVKSLPPSSLVSKAVKDVEKTVTRDASTDEKVAAFIPAYIAKGGRITPDFIKDVRDAFKTEVSVLDIGDGVTAVRVGNQSHMIDRNKPMSRPTIQDMKAEQYQSYLNQLAAKQDWASLDITTKQTLSSLAALHEKSMNMMGQKMSGQEAFEARRAQLLSKPESQQIGQVPSVKQGTPITADIAAALLKEANGNKDMARELARKRGYSLDTAK